MSNIVQAYVHALTFQALDIISVELRLQRGGDLPPFTPGAHIDLNLPNGLVRNYSLCNGSDETHRYVIAVLLDRNSRGGSRCVHESLRVGMPITVSAPRNNFALAEDAAYSVLVAGGIGITPLLCMARRLKSLGRSFEVLYFARERKGAAFLAELQAMGMPLHLHFDKEAGGPPDLRALLARRAPDAATHYYACGPAPMLDAFEKSCDALGHAHHHIERFAAVEVAASGEALKSFTVEARRSGKFLPVTADKSILDTLIDAGIDVDRSCCEGVCGTCETRVLDGIPDHRDSVLSAKERATNKTMMVCVGGSKSATLVLDI